MNNEQRIAIAAFSVAAILSAGAAVYIVSNKDKLHKKLLEIKDDLVAESRSRMDGMTEEVAIKTAKLTHNPKINQEWVEHQWDMI